MKVRNILISWVLILIPSILLASDFSIGIDRNIKLYGVTYEQIGQQAANACQEISKVCNVHFPYSTYPRIYITSSSLDMPRIGIWSNNQVILSNKYEWNEKLLFCVITHELLHALIGPEHDESPDSMLKKQIDYTMKLGSLNTIRLINKYGLPKGK